MLQGRRTEREKLHPIPTNAEPQRRLVCSARQSSPVSTKCGRVRQKKVSPKVKQEGDKGEGKRESTKANFRATNFPVKVGKNVKLVVYSVGGGEGTCVVSIAYSKHIYASMYRHGQTLIKMWRGVSHRSDDIATATVAKRGRCVWTRTSCSAFFFSSKSHTPRIETDRYTNTA